MAVCTACGQDNPEGFKLCGACGATLNRRAPTTGYLALVEATA